ncbi:MAG: hypothetical protein ACI9CD_000992 [Candidatus Deianiraeaceae bacterium]|jgi:hypothetical protein
MIYRKIDIAKRRTKALLALIDVISLFKKDCPTLCNALDLSFKGVINGL